jgi:hypothetical protein
MTHKRRNPEKIRSFDLPVSFRVNETRERFRDALNVFSNQGRAETRYGRSLFSSLSGSVLSMSFFKQSDGTKYLIAKVGTVLYKIDSAGVATSIKTGLSSTTKHRGITWNRGSASRHIISIEGDGLFQFNGTTVTQIGQAPPAAPTAASSATVGTLAYTAYSIYLTFYSSITGFESNKSSAVTVNVSSQKVIQDLTYTAKRLGAEGDLVTITYTAGGVAGAETISVTNNAINVTIATGVTTANQIKTIIEGNSAANALVSITVTGTGTNGQVAAAATSLTTGRRAIALSNIPATADNTTIDTVRVYMKASSSADDPVFSTEVALGTTSLTISSEPTSTQAPPEASGVPLSGGGKFLAEFNRKLVYAGNSTYKNDAFFSEEDFPDAFNDGAADGRLILTPIYSGEITGLATGLFNDSIMDPYLVIFKKRSIHVYSEIGGEPRFVPISAEVGCVSHDTIKVKNGNVYFLSEQGWRVIQNGRLVTDKDENPVTLGDGDIDDIFTSPGYVYEVNRSQIENAFSVFYQDLDQYMTWVAEGSSTSFGKTYVYEFKPKIKGFKPYQFNTAATCACTGEDSSNREVVFMADSSGKIYTHSIRESRADDDVSGTEQIIPAFAMLSWIGGNDKAVSQNFRDLHVEAIGSSNAITVKTWTNYTLRDLTAHAFEFPNPTSGIELDVSRLDEGIFGDERNIVPAVVDLNRTGRNILIGFYQSILNANINLVTAQLEMSQNRNRNA